MHKFGLIKKRIIYLALAFCLSNIANFTQANEVEQKAKQNIAEENKNTEYYTLVDPSIKPDKDEFYVKTIYKINGIPKALIARSNEQRTGEMFNFPSEYNIGDHLSDNLLIKDIVFKRGKKYIEVYKISNNKYYILKISYGNAKSRLILKNEQD